MVLGHVYTERQQYQYDQGRPVSDRREQAEGTLSSSNRLRLKDRKRWIDVWNTIRELESPPDQPLFDYLNKGPKVDADGAVCDRDAFAGLASQGGHKCAVRRPVGGHPGVCERVASDDLPDLVAYESLDSIGQRLGGGVEALRNPRRQAAGCQRIHSFIGQSCHVQLGK